MRSLRLVLAALLAVGLLAAAGCGGDDDEAAPDTTTTETTTTPAAGGTLVGSVGTADDPDAFVISLTTEDGTPVTTLSAGDYTLRIDDPSTIHNFHLSGPGGVDVASDVGGTDGEEFEITVEAGTYDYVCDPHAGSMNGSFEVSG